MCLSVFLFAREICIGIAPVSQLLNKNMFKLRCAHEERNMYPDTRVRILDTAMVHDTPRCAHDQRNMHPDRRERISDSAMQNNARDCIHDQCARHRKLNYTLVYKP